MRCAECHEGSPVPQGGNRLGTKMEPDRLDAYIGLMTAFHKAAPGDETVRKEHELHSWISKVYAWVRRVSFCDWQD